MTVLMFDSIQENIPRDAKACAGYVGGHWPTFVPFERDFPGLTREGRVVSVAINARERARFLDVETGDATPAECPGWWRQGFPDPSHGKPGFYCSASVVSTLVGTLTRAGIPRGDYLVWSAHYNFKAHICSPSVCGWPAADLTQFTDRANGQNLDESLCADYVFAPSAPPFPYQRFPVGPFAAPKQWFDGKHPNLARDGRKLNERKLVELYDHLNTHPFKNRYELHVVRQQLLFLRKRVWWVAHDEKIKGKPSWGIDYRGWRWHELNKRTSGVLKEW